MKYLHHDAELVAIDKPARQYVHPPEDKRIKVDPGETCVVQLERALGQRVYPVHRLDFATSGVMVFALSSEAAREIQGQFVRRQVEKHYWAVTRGWVRDATLDRPLGADNFIGNDQEAITRVALRGQLEVAHAIAPHPTARYSLVDAHPLTGRRHQIRRHLAHANHPIIGDVAHGDRHHNRFFHSHFKTEGLLLRAHSLTLKHPATGLPLVLEAPSNPMWENLASLFAAHSQHR